MARKKTEKQVTAAAKDWNARTFGTGRERDIHFTEEGFDPREVEARAAEIAVED